MSARYDMMLVLDLDETLVHACETPLNRTPDATVGSYAVYHRPHLHAFVEAVLSRFAYVGVWTASTRDYALPVLDTFVDRSRLHLVWCRRRCTVRYDREADSHVFLKPIKKLQRAGFQKERILVVDDSPEKLVRSYSNLVPVAPFLGDPADDELLRLLTYLDELGPLHNVRPIEKRWWRHRFSPQPR